MSPLAPIIVGRSKPNPEKPPRSFYPPYDRLVIDFAKRRVQFRGVVITMRPQHLRLFAMAAVSTASGAILTYPEIIEAMYGDDDGGGPDDPVGVIRVVVCRLRKQIAKIGLNITSNYQGYELVPLPFDYRAHIALAA